MRRPLVALLPVYFAVFFGFVGYSLMITVFTPLLIQENFQFLPAGTPLGVRTIVLGILLFLYPFAQFLSSPVLGALSDHLGRKSVLTPSLLLTALFYAGIAWALQEERLYSLMIFLFLAGLAEGNVTIAQSTIADVTSAKERNYFFGYIYLSASFAYILGPLLGGLFGNQSLIPWFSEEVPFWIVFFFLIFMFVWTLIFFKETHPRKIRGKINYFEAFTNLKNIFRLPRLRLFFLINFLLYLAIFGFFRSYPMYIVDTFDVGISKLSLFIAWLSVPIILINFRGIKYLSKRFTPFQLTLGSSFLIALFLILFILPKEVNALWITLFILGLALAIALPSCATFLSTKALPAEQGSVMGNNQSLQFLAEALSGLIGGLVAAIVIKLSLITFAFLSFLGGILLIFSKKR